MGTAYVDNIKEHSTGHGVHIPGHIIQIQKSVIFGNTQATSSTYLDVGHSLRITPKFANSQILLQNYAAGWHYSAGSPNSRGLRITRNGAELVTQDGQGYTEDGAWASMSWVTAFFDTTHNSTSELEYRILINGNRARFNDWAGYQQNTATFLAMEIAQ